VSSLEKRIKVVREFLKFLILVEVHSIGDGRGFAVAGSDPFCQLFYNVTANDVTPEDFFTDLSKHEVSFM
jgi:hypothetical protein